VGIFAQSLFATPPRVGGVQLTPFSAYHAQALIELDSPYLLPDVEITAGDTTAALIVCSSLRADGLNPVLRFSQSKRVRASWWLYWVFHNHETIAGILQDHILSSMRPPATWVDVEGGGGSSTGASWPYYAVSVCAQELHGIPYLHLWDMPLAELFCHKAIIGERNGDYKIAESELDARKRRAESQKESDRWQR